MRQRLTLPVLSVGSVMCLLAPWMRSGSVDRSSIEMLSSASALDVLGGVREWLVLSAWVALPVMAAVVVVAGAWQRTTIAALAAVPIGPLMVVAHLAVSSSPFPVLWGAWLGAALGVMATSLASLLLIEETNRRKARS